MRILLSETVETAQLLFRRDSCFFGFLRPFHNFYLHLVLLLL